MNKATIEQRIEKLERDFKRYAEMLFIPDEECGKASIWDKFFKPAPESGDLTEGAIAELQKCVNRGPLEVSVWVARLISEVRRRRGEERIPIELHDCFRSAMNSSYERELRRAIPEPTKALFIRKDGTRFERECMAEFVAVRDGEIFYKSIAPNVYLEQE